MTEQNMNKNQKPDCPAAPPRYTDIQSELIGFFANALHVMDLFEDGIKQPTAEQLEGWNDKYIGRVGAIPSPEKRIQCNIFRARVDRLVLGALHIFDKYNAAPTKNNRRK